MEVVAVMPKVHIEAEVDTGPGDPRFFMDADVHCIELPGKYGRDVLIANALRATADRIDPPKGDA